MLPLTTSWHDDETLVSFCSRTAAVNGIPTAMEFAGSVGLQLDGIVRGDAVQVKKLAALSGEVGASLFANAIHRTGKRALVRGEWFSPDMLETSYLRVCPHCIRDDRDKGNSSLRHCYGRLAWTIKLARICPLHSVEIVTLRADRSLFGEFYAQLDRSHRRIERLASSVECFEASPLNDYLFARLDGRKAGHPWLDTLPLQAAIHTTELLGSCIRDGLEADFESYSTGDWVECGTLGFDATAKDNDEVEAALATIIRDTTLPNKLGDPDIVFGRLAAELWQRSTHPGYLTVLGVLQNVAMADLARKMTAL